MAGYLVPVPILHLIIFQAVVLLIILSNAWLLHRARRHAPPAVFPMVSLLIPARDEEKDIAACIQSLLRQDYPSFEVLALDDQSSDRTLSILEQLAAENSMLQVLVGSPPPAGQVGKNWACAQLAQQAHGELLFFTDADTLHQPDMLRLSVSALIGEQADLLTGFPRQEVHSWGERLLVPFFSWALYCFNPLWLAYRLRLPVLSNAVGQMMLFRRPAYQAIGGHAAAGAAIAEDLVLARRIKAAGLRWRVMHATDLVSCRMYPGSRLAFDGFAKNLFAAFDFRLLEFLFAFVWLAVLFWEPLVALVLVLLGRAPLLRLDELGGCIGLSLLIWLIPYIELGIPPVLAYLYPLTLLANEAAALQSLLFSLTGRLTWKDRTLPRPRWKWL
jgi:chlorobactene glucosyltransferase